MPEPLLVGLGQSVLYAGQAIAIVLADTQAHADSAALLVMATYTNMQTPILSIADALANPARGVINYNIPPLESGNVQAALATAPNVIQVGPLIFIRHAELAQSW